MNTITAINSLIYFMFQSRKSTIFLDLRVLFSFLVMVSFIFNRQLSMKWIQVDKNQGNIKKHVVFTASFINLPLFAVTGLISSYTIDTFVQLLLKFRPYRFNHILNHLPANLSNLCTFRLITHAVLKHNIAVLGVLFSTLKTPCRLKSTSFNS